MIKIAAIIGEALQLICGGFFAERARKITDLRRASALLIEADRRVRLLAGLYESRVAKGKL